MEDPEVLFLRDGERFVPTGWTRGPWDPQACHGGAPAALLAQTLDVHPASAPMRIARLTFEVLRPVPLSPLRLSVAVEREGRRVQLLTGSLFEGDTEVMRVRALRQRTTELDLPGGLPTFAEAGDEPDSFAIYRSPFPEEWGHTFIDAMDLRTGASPLLDPGPGVGWFRLRLPVVDDEPARPVARVAAVADFGNGLAPPLPLDGYLFINPDLTVSLLREPVDEWVRMDVESEANANGSGVAVAAIHDRHGRIGTGIQTLFLDRR